MVWPTLGSRTAKEQEQNRNKRMAIILSNFNRFSIFFTERFLGKFAIKSLLKFHHSFLAYVAISLIFCNVSQGSDLVKHERKQGIDDYANYKVV